MEWSLCFALCFVVAVGVSDGCVCLTIAREDVAG
jgi:hypothetical protein